MYFQDILGDNEYTYADQLNNRDVTFVKQQEHMESNASILKIEPLTLNAQTEE